MVGKLENNKGRCSLFANHSLLGANLRLEGFYLQMTEQHHLLAFKITSLWFIWNKELTKQRKFMHKTYVFTQIFKKWNLPYLRWKICKKMIKENVRSKREYHNTNRRWKLFLPRRILYRKWSLLRRRLTRWLKWKRWDLTWLFFKIKWLISTYW